MPTVNSELQETNEALNRWINGMQLMGVDHPQTKTEDAGMDFPVSKINEDITVEDKLIIVLLTYEESDTCETPLIQQQCSLIQSREWMHE